MSSAPTLRRSVLVVDDEEPILDLVRALLRPYDLHCVVAGDADQAAAVLDERLVDLVVCDAHLQGEGARGVLARARAEEPPIPVILLVRQRPMADTGSETEDTVYDRLRKPFELSRLPGVALRALETRRLGRENSALREALALQRVVQAVHASIDEREFLKDALASMSRALVADRVSLFVREAGRRRLVRWGASFEGAGPLATLEERLAARAAASGAALLLPGDSSEPVHLAGQAHTALAIPLLGEEGPLGVVVALRQHGPGVFQAAHVQTLSFLARNVSAVMAATRRARHAVGSAVEDGLHRPTLEELVVAMDARGHETHGHSRRVAEYAARLAAAMGSMPPSELADLELAGLFHDVGNLAVPDRVLLKAGPLTEEERGLLERHPAIGHEMLRGIAGLAGAAELVLAHHERFDGSGYPAGLAGEDVPRGARILGVADTLEAMTQDRPFRRALTYADAVAEITRRRAGQFDPVVVEAFLAVPEEEWGEIRQRSELLALPVHRLPLPAPTGPSPVVQIHSIGG